MSPLNIKKKFLILLVIYLFVLRLFILKYVNVTNYKEKGKPVLFRYWWENKYKVIYQHVFKLLFQKISKKKITLLHFRLISVDFKRNLETGKKLVKISIF